jgi:DNA (cytosine-5)-methyltransferase 1
MKHLRVGTDCSGIEAPIQALQQLDVPFIHEWSCEKDPYTLESLKANYEPKIIYQDISTRNHSELPDIDLYVCGFPCQTFSILVHRTDALSDPRSNIMYECIKVIQQKKPKYFVLENVKNFKTFENGKPFNTLMDALDSTGVYNVHADIYNTLEHGIPQRRKRVYIVGIRKDIQTKIFQKPPILPLRDIDEFLEDKTIYKRTNISKVLQGHINKLKERNDYSEDASYIITDSNYGAIAKDCSPTLTSKCNTFYHTKYNRYLTPRECLNLQGFSKDFKQVTSKTQMCKQIGNTMSVNVLKEISLLH